MDCLTGCVIKGRPKEGRLKWSRTARRAGSLHDTGGRRAVTRTPLLFSVLLIAAAELGPQRVHALHGQSRVVSRGESRLMIRCISWMRRAALRASCCSWLLDVGLSTRELAVARLGDALVLTSARKCENNLLDVLEQ